MRHETWLKDGGSALGAPKPLKCTCTVDGVVGKTFETMDPTTRGTIESATAIANEQCGWHIHH